MAKPIKFRIAAYTSAAARDNNEDALLVHDDLAIGPIGHFETDKIVDLGPKGALLVVADGMGGMNAGEVASGITCATLQEVFTPDNITKEVLSSEDNIKKFLRNAIIKADENIKKEGRNDPEKEGMGSTVVIGWIIKDRIFVGWCGDSRLYCFNKKTGLIQLSHDHSYVQELVDSGQIDEETAFFHPNSNIITRSLGDLRGKARPDVDSFALHNGDIILLCSDGLSGALQNHEISEIMNNTSSTMDGCMKALWIGAEKAGWTDNVTTILCEIISGAKNIKPLQNTGSDLIKRHDSLSVKHLKNKGLYYIIAGAVVFLGTLFGVLFGVNRTHQEEMNEKLIEIAVTQNKEDKCNGMTKDDNENKGTDGTNGDTNYYDEEYQEYIQNNDHSETNKKLEIQNKIKSYEVDSEKTSDDENGVLKEKEIEELRDKIKGDKGDEPAIEVKKDDVMRLEYEIEEDMSESELKLKLKSIIPKCSKDGRPLEQSEAEHIIKKLDGKKLRVNNISGKDEKTGKCKKGDTVTIELKFK